MIDRRTFAELDRLHGPAIDHLSPWSRTQLYGMAKERAGKNCNREVLRYQALQVWAEQLREQDAETAAATTLTGGSV
jgi:hypothetical protein